MNLRPALLAASWAAVGMALLAPAPLARAQDATATPPQVVVEPVAVDPGDPVIVRISGFRTHNVTVTVCGNGAARGSVDCHQAAGVDLALQGDPTVSDIVAVAPPAPCPCVVRVGSRTYDEVAVAPIELRGHPVAEVVRAEASVLLDVSIDARRAPVGVVDRVRSALGGPTVYEVEVTVQNRSGLPLSEVSVGASAQRGGDGVAAVDLPAVGSLAPGATWSQVATATVPAPVLGPLTWEATAAGAGPTVSAVTSSRPVPYLLLVLVALLAGDVVAMVTRRLTGRGRARRRRPAPVPA